MHHQYSSSVSPFQAKTGTPAGFSTVPFGPTATAAAAWSWVEKMLQLAQRTRAPERGQGLDEDCRLDGHVQGPGDAGACEGLGGGELRAHRHEAGHLVFGEDDLLAAKFGSREVGHLEGQCGLLVRHGNSFSIGFHGAGAQALDGPYGGSATHVLRPLSEAVYPPTG